MLNGFRGHHRSQISAPGGVADHRGSAAEQGDRAIARHLQTLHQTQRHKMSHVEAVRSRVESDVECSFSVVDQFPDFFLVRHLRDQAAGDQFII